MSSESQRDPDPGSNRNEITFDAHPAEFVDEFREDLEAITEDVTPVLPLIESLLDRHSRGEKKC